MTDHPDRLTILAYLEEEEGIDRDAIASHLASCSACESEWQDLLRLATRLGDGAIFNFIDDAAVDTDRPLMRQHLIEQATRAEAEAVDAERLMARLRQHPVETWKSLFADATEHCTSAMVQRVLQDVDLELDRSPANALRMIDVAEFIAFALSGDAGRLNLGHVWKQRSNALRQLARYHEAIDAATQAESFYASVIIGDFDAGQAQYARAAALFKMTHYSEALGALMQARATLESYGTTLPLAKVTMLEAAIRIEQGDVLLARKMWREVLPMLEEFGEILEVARIRANLVECNLRLGSLDDALRDARAVINTYRQLGNEVEELRATWTLALVELAGGDADGLSRLYTVAAAFLARGMAGDAGLVKLDITEELLRRGEWLEAELIARELVPVFSAAGVTLASITALDCLRQAVEKHEATAYTVVSVREYVNVDDPHRLFVLLHHPATS
jgi:tetratricopeptide (TPR) repeat protein